jgi:4-alpha-glucanotransferase
LNRPAGNSSEAAPALIDSAWSSVAALAIAPLQDVLNLGNEGRMNIPGRGDGNWRWRCTEEMIHGPVFEWLRTLTDSSRRSQGKEATADGEVAQVARG